MRSDVLSPAVQLILREAIVPNDLVFQFLVRHRYRNRQAAIFFILKADVDWRLRWEVGRQGTHGTLADLGTIIGRRAFAFDDLQQD